MDEISYLVASCRTQWIASSIATRDRGLSVGVRTGQPESGITRDKNGERSFSICHMLNLSK